MDLAKSSQTLLATSVQLRQGRGQTEIDLPAELSGTLKVHTYRIGEHGEMIRTTNIVHVLPKDSINIALATDQRSYRPGETARVRLRARSQDGAPAVAAIGLTAVDESVLHLAGQQLGQEQERLNLSDDLLGPLRRERILSSVRAQSSLTDWSPRLGRAAMSVASAAVPASIDALVAEQYHPRRLALAREYMQEAGYHNLPAYLREEAAVLRDVPEYGICRNTYPAAARRAAREREREMQGDCQDWLVHGDLRRGRHSSGLGLGAQSELTKDGQSGPHVSGDNPRLLINDL